jgi:hypothetical protein
MRLLKTTKHFYVIFILFIVLNVFLTVNFIQSNEYFTDNNDQDEFYQPYSPKASNGNPLSYSAIDQTATTIYRLFESVNFSIDTFGYGVVDYALIQIEFSNGSIINYDMEYTSLNEYSYEFQPKYNAPLGFQNVSFLIYNITDTLLNAHTTFTNFTIITNYMAITNSSEYYIGDELYAELIVSDFGSYQFGWNLTIVNSTIEAEQNNITNFEYKAVQFTYYIDNETFHSVVDHTFYIKLNMTDLLSGKKVAAYFPFEVLNSNPIIDISSIIFSPTSVKRAEDCEISLNITDLEDIPKHLDVNMDIEDPLGNLVTTVSIDYNSENNFSKVFSIPAGRPIGKYKLIITAEDRLGGIDSFTTTLTVTNNLPEIHSYEINGRSSDQGLLISYGNDLIFTFNVSDVEGVAYIKVALLDENNDWYNLTKDYKGIDTEIRIRTEELITGVWYAYIYVIDYDGAITSLIDDYDMAPQAITIIPDALSTYLPWIIFIVGVILGILVSIGLASRHYKLKIGDTKASSPKKKDVPSKKIRRRKEEKEEEPEQIQEDEKIEETVAKKEEESIPKRKIKRKL